MAMPTFAAASAGASLTPSPAMATIRPSFCSANTCLNLSSGMTSAFTSSSPNCLATACAVVALSPVSTTIRRPDARSWPIASSVVDLIGSATLTRPASRLSKPRNMTVWPSSRSRCASTSMGAASMPEACIRRRLPSMTSLPSIWPRTPWPVTDSNCSTAASGMCFSCA